MPPAPPKHLNGLLSRWVKGFRIRAAVREMGAPGAVLDLGSGLCEILDWIGKEVSYEGVERDRWMFERAVRLYPRHRFWNADLEDPEFQPSVRVECILMLAVWEHLRDPEGLLQRARGWVAPRGRMIITTPSPRAHALLELGSKLHLLSRNADEEHERLWSVEEVGAAARRGGWEVRKMERFLFGANQMIVLEAKG